MNISISVSASLLPLPDANPHEGHLAVVREDLHTLRHVCHLDLDAIIIKIAPPCFIVRICASEGPSQLRTIVQQCLRATSGYIGEPLRLP